MTDVIVIGGGLNGLVAAAALAKAKLSVILLDQRPVTGGAAITAEFHPGFRGPALSHSLGPLNREVVRGIGLDRVRDLELISPEPVLTTIGADGRVLAFHRDPVLTSASINALSAADAGRWREFLQVSQRIAGVLARLDTHAPPDIDDVSRRDGWHFMSVGRAARKLGRRDLSRLVRWMPMPIGDLAGEWFESELLRAAIAAHAISGNPAGPRSAGTGAMWLQRLAANPSPVGSGITARGGPGAVAAAIAKLATDKGASLRTDARVVQITASNGRATGVVLENGDQLSARAIVAAISPKAALGELVPPAALPPTVADRVRHLRTRGVTAKINLALSGLPSFSALAGDAVPLGGRILLGPDLDYLERAFDATKYGQMSERPWLELALPTVNDPSLAPAGSHVMSVYAHFAPRELRGAPWSGARNALWSAVLAVVEGYAPSFSTLVEGREVLTPEDLDLGWGLPGGNIFHVESTLDQFWAARPLLGWARYRSPLAGLYLASAGAHPGGGLTGLPGWLAAQTVREESQTQVRT